MDRAVDKYRKRRKKRLDARNMVENRYDSVELYRARRNKRLKARMDAGQGWVFGALKANGVDTEGMGLGDAYKAWNELQDKNGKKSAHGRPLGKKKAPKEENSGGSKHGSSEKVYVSKKEASDAPKIGNYTRKNHFKNGYGATDVGKDEWNDLKNGLTMHDNANENGEWTEEREALHSKIIDNFFDGKKKADGKPETIFMGGGPASGKTYVKDSFGKDFGIPDGCVLSDPDECKKGLPEYNQNTPWFVHEESSSLSKRIAKLSQENGYNTLIDGTGDGSVEKMRKKIQQAKDAGNVVKGRYVFMPVEDAIQLNHKRDRSIDPAELVKTHRKISSILPEIAPDFDDVELYANVIGGKPKLIAKGGGGKPLEILDNDLYNRFLNNGSYEYNKNRVRELESTPLARKKHKVFKKTR